MSSLLGLLAALFLFTKSDIKTTIIPVTAFASAAGPVASWSRLGLSVLWTWMHLLQFDISNQLLDPEEDKVNKPDRPLPSGRISYRHAAYLRYGLIPVCLIISLSQSLQCFLASVSLLVVTAVHNEGRGSHHYWSKNLINGAGVASFQWGASLAASGNPTTLDATGTLAILLSIGIVVTTIHAQDFKDVIGDRAVGRKTLPIVYPRYSRFTMLVNLVAWSYLLSEIWRLDYICSSAIIALAILMGIRFILLHSTADDQVSYYIYNVWVMMVSLLPGYWRLVVLPAEGSTG